MNDINLYYTVGIVNGDRDSCIYGPHFLLGIIEKAGDCVAHVAFCISNSL